MPDLENFPDDDEVALLLYIEEFTAKHNEELAQLDDNDDVRYIGIEFMNNVLAAARALEVAEFDRWQVPEWGEAYGVISEFKLFTKSYVIRAEIKKARSGKAYSVALDTATRERIHFLINKIRKVLEGADIEERKRNSLYAKLNVFEADVDRARTRFENAMALIADAAYTAKTAGESLVPVTDFLNSISELLGKAKAKEGDLRLPPPTERKKIEGPREKADSPNFDEIPF